MDKRKPRSDKREWKKDFVHAASQERNHFDYSFFLSPTLLVGFYSNRSGRVTHEKANIVVEIQSIIHIYRSQM